jgi:hypothetical protein
MTFEQVRELVHYESLKYWDDIKQASLIQHIIPFAKVSYEGVEEMVMHHIYTQLPSLPRLKRIQIHILMLYDLWRVCSKF